jgi:protein-L-isoaspartate(D-aspartate) O-methyltransferase
MPSEAPFDGIIVTAGAPTIPETLRNQLADGGRLVIPVGPPHNQVLMLAVRRGTGFESEPHGACSFVPLIGRFGWKA